MSCSIDTTIVKTQIDLEQLSGKTGENLFDLQLACATTVFKIVLSISNVGKIFSMDVSSEYMVTGHDKYLTLWNVESS